MGRISRACRPPLLALLLALGLATVVLVARPGTATACSCASPHPLDVVAQVDTVFVGRLVENVGDSSAPRWQFDVDSVVKGEARTTEVVAADDFASGCGTSYSVEMGLVVVYANRKGDELTAPGCIPAPPVDAFRTMVAADQTPPTGTGPPAVVMSGTVGSTDLAVLDASGRTLARAGVDAGRGPVVQCNGTSRVAVAAYASREIVLVDVASLDVIARRPIDNDELYAAESIACLDGGDRVVVTTGFAPNTGAMRVTTSNAESVGSDDRSVRFTEFSRGIAHPAGTVLLLPWQVGEPVRALAVDDLEPIDGGDLALPEGTSVIDGAVSTDGARLAMLATVSGRPVEYYGAATHMLLVDLESGVPRAGSLRTFELAEPGGRLEDRFGAANQIDWLDDESLAISRETMSSRVLQLVGTDGTPRSELADIGWGWGFVAVAEGFVRVRDGGVELVRPDGSASPGDPAPSDTYVDRFLSLAPLVDVPALDPSVDDDHATIEFTPPSDGEAAVGSTVESTVGPPVESGSPTTPDDTDTDSGNGRSTWAVAVAIAGLAAILVVGGLVVLRPRRD